MFPKTNVSVISVNGKTQNTINVKVNAYNINTPNQELFYTLAVIRNCNNRDFLGGPVAKTLHSQCRGPEFNPWLGTRSHMLQQ